MLHEIGCGKPDALFSGANPPLGRSRQSLRYGQGTGVLKRNGADYPLRAQRFRTAPADSFAIDNIRYQTHRATIWTGWRHLQPRTLSRMRRVLHRARGVRPLVIRRRTIFIRRIEARRHARLSLGFFLARSMRQGEVSGAADMFIADLGRGLPRRQGARRLDDGEITSDPIQLVFDRESGDGR
jgi:hypothetical protein